jgi:hypothetical protein
MRVIPPLTGASPSITEAMLTSSNVVESETQWVSGATYAALSVRRGNGAYSHRMFESVQDGNLNHPVSDPLWWRDIGPTNRWACFDLLRNTGTVRASPMIVEVTPGRRVDSIGLAGLVAESILVEVIVAGVVIYSHFEDLSTRIVTNWYQYFTAEFTFREEVALFDLPPVTSATQRITITSASGDVTCGAIVLGTSVFLGDVEPSAEDDALNFSTVDRDFAGNAILIPRRTLPKTSQVCWIDKGGVTAARAVRDLLNAVPAMWVGLDDPNHNYFSSLLILGIYLRFTINLDYEEIARIALELEEV